jgi:hypothetical protein
VFVRGADGAVYQNALVNRSWRGWQSLGGISTSAPAVVWRRGAANYFDVAVKGTDNAIYFNTWVPGGVARRQPHIRARAEFAVRRHRQRVGARD